MAIADPALLDARVRAAEITLAAHYGRTLVERSVSLSGGSAVRVLDFPAVGSAASAEFPDEPPIVLLHGMASVSALAMPVVGALASRRVLALDWPGHGLSGLAPHPSGAELRTHVVAVLESLLAGFGLEQADFIGHGVGGQFALYLALARPARVRRLVLLGAPGLALHAATPTFRMRVRTVPALGTALLALSTSEPAHSRGVEQLLGRGALATLPPEAPEIAYLISQRPEYAPGLSALTRSLMTPFGVRPGIAVHSAELARLTVPLLVVWGDHDALLDPESGRADLEVVPGVELLEIGGGHAPWLDEPARVGLAVSTFLTGYGRSR